MFCPRLLLTLLGNDCDIRVDCLQAEPLDISGDPVNSGMLGSPGSHPQGVPLHPPSTTHVLTIATSNYRWGLSAVPCWAKECDRGISSLHINFLELESFPCLEVISGVAVWHSCSGSGGHHDGDGLSEHCGRDQVQEPRLEGLGDYSVVSELKDFSSPHFGPQQHLIVKSSTVGGYIECSPHPRVISLILAIWEQPTVELFATWLNHNFETSYSHLPDPLTLRGNPCRWIISRVFHVFCTCFSPPPPPIPFSSEGDSGESSGHCDSSVVALAGVVGLAGPCGPASVAARAWRCSPHTRRVGIPKCPGISPRHLESLGRSRCGSGISIEATATVCTAHRPSTRNLYHAKWHCFCCWCSRREKEPLYPSVRTVNSAEVFSIYSIWTRNIQLSLAISLPIVHAWTRLREYLWVIIPRWLSGFLVTDHKIFLYNQSSLHGIC